MKNTLLVIIPLMFVYSCSKNDDPDPAEPQTNYRVSEVQFVSNSEYEGGSTVSTFIYDNNSKLTKVIEVKKYDYSDSETFTTDFYYADDGTVTKTFTGGWLDGEHEYLYYSGDELTGSYSPFYEYDTRMSVLCNSNGIYKLISDDGDYKEYYYLDNGKVDSVYNYSTYEGSWYAKYTYEGGKLITIEENEDYEDDGTYDPNDKLVFVYLNNQLASIKFYNKDGIYRWEYQFEYNTEGMVSTIKEVDADEPIQPLYTYTITYEEGVGNTYDFINGFDGGIGYIYEWSSIWGIQTAGYAPW